MSGVPLRVYFSSCSVGPRPSERVAATKAEAATDKERRRSDITETEGDQGGSPKGLAAGRSQDGLLE